MRVRKPILSLVVGLATILGLALASPASPAYADSIHLAGNVNQNFCHLNNCNLGFVQVSTGIVQYRNQFDEVQGTEAFCQIQPGVGVARVQVNSCRLGIVSGPAISVSPSPAKNQSTLIQYRQPAPPFYINTIHDSTVTGADFDLKAVGDYSIRWSDGSLSAVQTVRSLQSNDYFCISSCHAITLP
jgi:hypothetical protein